jgi:hypothetical protein
MQTYAVKFLSYKKNQLALKTGEKGLNLTVRKLYHCFLIRYYFLC